MTSVPVGNTYDKYGSRHAVERRMVAGFMAALEELLPADPRRVLEVGCGEGHHMRRLGELRPAARVVGIDVADAGQLAAWHGQNRPVAVADVADLPFPSGDFDLVLALEVLEHVPDPRAALAEIDRVVDGVVILSVPWEPVWRAGNLARGRYLAQLGNTPGHLQHFTRRQFLRAVAERFEVDAVRRPLPWTFVRARTRLGP